MTIPIIPGPFSFVKDIGEGIAGAINAKEQARRRQMAERTQTASIVLDLIGKKVLKQNVLATDEMLELFQSINVDFSAEDLQGESLADTKESIELGFLESLQPQTTPELQPGGVLPGISTGPTTQRPESPAEAKARRQATTPTAQRLALGLPSEEDITTQRARDAAAGTTAAVGIGAAQLTALTPIVDIAVEGAFIAGQAEGNPPLFDENFVVNPQARDAIWESVQANALARGTPLDPRDRILVDAAIGRKRAQEHAQAIAEMAAQSTAALRSGTVDRDLLRSLQAEVRELGDTKKILQDRLDEPLNAAAFTVLSRRKSAGETLSPDEKSRLDDFQQMQNEIQLNDAMIANLRGQMQRQFGVQFQGPEVITAGSAVRRGLGASSTDAITITDPTSGRTIQAPTEDVVREVSAQTNPVQTLLSMFNGGEITQIDLMIVIQAMISLPGLDAQKLRSMLELQEQLAPVTIGR